jgi:CobQ/CobB/MinD/ParA nucleotide binding domain
MVACCANNARSNMKTIAIISQKGGAGKTTIGIHLAVAAEKRGMKTALFDLDPQASVSSWSDKRNQPSPAVVSAQASPHPQLYCQQRAATGSSNGLSTNPGPARSSEIPLHTLIRRPRSAHRQRATGLAGNPRSSSSASNRWKSSRSRSEFRSGSRAASLASLKPTAMALRSMATPRSL